jgi:hypothetical protein
VIGEEALVVAWPSSMGGLEDGSESISTLGVSSSFDSLVCSGIVFVGTGFLTVVGEVPGVSIASGLSDRGIK